MALLTTATQLIRVITGAAADIDAYVDFVDYVASTITPGNQLTPGIVTAATTTICAAPVTGVRKLRHISLRNNHATASTTVDVELFDGTNPTEMFAVTLLPNETLKMSEARTWHHRDVQGAEYSYTVPADSNLGATGVIAETMPRETCPEVNTTVATTGVLFLNAIRLTAGQLVSNISVCGATTGAGTPTNYRAGLYSAARALLATSADQLVTAFAANTYRTFAMTTAYRVPTSGLYYIGYYMVATTVATLKGGTAKTGGQLGATVPILHGTSTTGLTTTLPDPAAAITTGTASIYAAVS